MISMAQPVEQVRELLQNMTVESQVKPAKEVPPKDGNSSDGSNDSPGIGVNGATKSSVDKHVKTEPSVYYAANGYVLPQGYFYGGYDLGELDDYARYVGIDPSELHSGAYGENGSMIYHPSYGYASQSPYGPYPPTIGVDGQLYGPAAFQYPGQLYHQSGVHYFPSPPGSATGETPPAVSKDPGPRGADGSNGASGFRPRPGFPMAMVSPHPYRRGLVMHSQDARASYDARGGLTRSEAGKAPERKQSSSAVSQTSSRAAPPFQVRLSKPQQQAAAATPGPGALGGGYPPLSRVIPHNMGREAPPSGATNLDVMHNGRSWAGTEKGKQKGRAVFSLGNGMGNPDFMNEQNRGPRTARIKSHRPIPGIIRQTKGPGDAHGELLKDQYNKPDFVTKYNEARFFVIKSYSEDDIHKSIKYNVWASTPNGNKRLDAAFQESRAKSAPKLGGCPIFLFFSVNASGQFCGVAEMTGPVDFLKSMDFWQQDKWNGCFTVKWHIIKDVPNSQFRHIILESNDNKPVTNSRDTQEVKCEQGVEMLSIFKNYATKISILDDFQFYESRQKSVQEKKVRQQAQVNKCASHVEGMSKIATEIAKGFIPAEIANNAAAAGVPKANGQTMSSEGGVAEFTCNMNGNVTVEEQDTPAVKV